MKYYSLLFTSLCYNMFYNISKLDNKQGYRD